MSDLVPFGKHKGKPLNALLDDREYLDWVLEQPWFRQKYGNIYQIVINNGQEPSETPEHNLMQAQYLDSMYTYSVLKPYYQERDIGIDHIYFEPEGGGDVGVLFSWTSPRDRKDVWRTAIIELKPTLGDDYPAVLRAMKRIPSEDKEQGTRVSKFLVIRNFSAAISRTQLVEIFKASDVQVVFEDQIVILKDDE